LREAREKLMVDRVTASQGADVLAVAIAEFMEDTIDGAIRPPKDLGARLCGNGPR
jgi:hypothetical protein